MDYLLFFFVIQFFGYGISLDVKGLVPSVFTPFDDDGELNLDVIPEYAEYLHKNNVNGVLVAGTASEGPALSLNERKYLLDAWISAARPLGLKVVMQVGGLPLPEVLELARYCERTGPDAILTLPELYYKPADEDALVRYVKLVSDAAPSLPILYYDHPSLSGVKLNMAKFFNEATKSIPNFKGIKCNFVTAVDISASNNLNDDQRIFMASHSTTASADLMGYNSSMTTISNLFPGMMLDIERAVQQNDLIEARTLQHELNKRVAVITEQGSYVPFVKAAMEYISGIKRDIPGSCQHCTDRVCDETLNATGLVPTVFTPFDDDGKLNLEVIPDYAKYLSKNKCNGAMVAGTASEGPSLSLKERKSLLDAWVTAAAPLNLNVVMQVGGLPMPEVLELARYCESAAPDAIITPPELYYQPSDVDSLVRYVKLVSEAAPKLPILYYDHCPLNGVSVSMPKFFRQATKAIGNFKGIKCSFMTAVRICAANDIKNGQRIFVSEYEPMASAYMMGFDSTMTAVANVFPEMFLDMEQAVSRNDVRTARSLQLEVNKRVNVIKEQGPYVPFVKAAFECTSGVKVGNTRDPLPRVTTEQRKIQAEKIRKLIG